MRIFTLSVKLANDRFAGSAPESRHSGPGPLVPICKAPQLRSLESIRGHLFDCAKFTVNDAMAIGAEAFKIFERGLGDVIEIG